MPTDRLLPLSQGFYSQFSLVGAATKSLALRSDDGDTTRIQQSSAAVVRDTHYVDPLSAAEKIFNVDVAIKSRRVTGPFTFSMPIMFVATTLVASGAQCINPTVGYTLNTWTGVPRPSGVWVPGDFPGGGAGAEIGISTCNTGNVNAIACTWAYTDVTYSDAVGDFTINIAQWIPPLIALASHGLMRREVAEILSRVKTRPAFSSEFRKLLEAFRVRPRFCFLAGGGS